MSQIQPSQIKFKMSKSALDCYINIAITNNVIKCFPIKWHGVTCYKSKRPKAPSGCSSLLYPMPTVDSHLHFSWWSIRFKGKPRDLIPLSFFLFDFGLGLGTQTCQ